VNYLELEAAIAGWCRRQPAIRAALVVGSRGRADPDDWADLDLVLFTPAPEAYAAGPEWLAEVAPAWLTYLDQTGRGDPEWFALFDDGLKADFVFARAAPAASGLAEMLAATSFQSVFSRGARVLYAAGGLDPALPHLAAPARRLPSARELEQHTAGALLAASKAARLLQRGDLWRAYRLINCVLKDRLLAMLEWHAWAIAPGALPDTWHAGRGLADWSAPHALAALPGTFGGYDPDSLWRALEASLDLYAQLRRETAAALGCADPDEAEARLRAWLRTLR
jgi:aminoglycoside 6-adenylyltransferase